MTAVEGAHVDNIDRDRFVREWETWHRDHEAALADPHGFLAITSIHWLAETPCRFPDAPGAWSTGPDGVTVILDGTDELIVDGSLRRGRYSFGVIPERASILARFGDNAVEVAKRGGYDLIRPRHADHPLRVGFTGTPTFPPDRRWVVTGRYAPFSQPRPTAVGAVVDGLEHVYNAMGRIEFRLADTALSLTAFAGDEGRLMTLFTDTTSGVTTYAANRVLVVDSPDGSGAVTLDFNRATNLPCAYTDLATCPLPPAENRLAVAIEAGERIPRERQDPSVSQAGRPPLPAKP